MVGANGTCARWHGGAVDHGCLPNVARFAPWICSSGREVDLDGIQEFWKKSASSATARLTSSCFALGAVVARGRFAAGTDDGKRCTDGELEVPHENVCDLGAQARGISCLKGCVERSVE